MHAYDCPLNLIIFVVAVSKDGASRASFHALEGMLNCMIFYFYLGYFSLEYISFDWFFDEHLLLGVPFYIVLTVCWKCDIFVLFWVMGEDGWNLLRRESLLEAEDGEITSYWVIF